MSDLHTETADQLFDAILALKDREECYRFFEDLCTITELQSMSQRFHVAQLLRRGLVYNEVGRLSGASSATISRVNRALTYGPGGYGTVLSRMETKEAEGRAPRRATWRNGPTTPSGNCLPAGGTNAIR